MFRLRTFGGLWLERAHQRVAEASPRRLGLLAAVVAAGDHGLSRDRLLLLLWPDTSEAKARHALAQTLYSFRRELGTDLIRSGPNELLIDPEQLGSDLTEFLDASARGDFERAAELYSGPFLDGFSSAGPKSSEPGFGSSRSRRSKAPPARPPRQGAAKPPPRTGADSASSPLSIPGWPWDT